MTDQTEKFNLTKHLPVGSIIIDSSLVLTLVFSQGQTTEALKAIETRVARIEQQQGLPDRAVQAQIKAVEDENHRQDAITQALKEDVVARLQRIENKLDRIR